MTMLHIDLKYIMMIAHRFDRFKRKDDYLFNFRCPICGDSSSKKNKARGYLYKKKNDMFYKCHNCGAGKTFGGLLKDTDPLIAFAPPKPDTRSVLNIPIIRDLRDH